MLPAVALSYQKENPIFGASRLGVYTREVATKFSVTMAKTSYEITDHLGNVRAVIQENPNLFSILLSYADYYAFGEQLPSRNTTSDYRYAFQGQELDKETGMEAFQLRLWDGRIGRWLSPDPYGQYASPYLGMGNNPISLIDPDGGQTIDPPTKNGGVLKEVVVFSGKSHNSWSNSFAHSLSTNSLFFEQSSNIRNNFYKPSEKFYYEAFKKGELSQFEYATKRYNLQGETRARLPQVGKAISELEMSRKAQMQNYYEYAAGNKDIRVKAENTRNFGIRGALMKGASRALIVYGAYKSIEHIHNAQNKGLAISQEAGGWSGSLALAGEFALAGSVFGPVGTLVGGVIGGGVGYYMGSQAGEIIYNKF